MKKKKLRLKFIHIVCWQAKGETKDHLLLPGKFSENLFLNSEKN